MFSNSSPKERWTATIGAIALGAVLCFLGAQKLRGEPDIHIQTDVGSSPNGAKQALGFVSTGLGEESESVASPPKPDRLVVHIVGEVNKPGILEFEPGQRVIDAIAKAGGSKPNADLEAVNLAAELVDGTQLKVPRKSESTSAIELIDPAYSGRASNEKYVRKPTGSRSSSSSGTPAAQSVSLNTASASELDRLPGVGPATAQKILEYRRQTGGFSSIDELLSVKGIGPKKLAAMRKYLRL